MYKSILSQIPQVARLVAVFYPVNVYLVYFHLWQQWYLNSTEHSLSQAWNILEIFMILLVPIAWYAQIRWLQNIFNWLKPFSKWIKLLCALIALSTLIMTVMWWWYVSVFAVYITMVLLLTLITSFDRW
jgi:hypothetical protein